LVSAARAAGTGTIWVQGDTALALRLIEAGLVDRLELFVMPLALGTGSEYIGPETLARFDAGASQTFSNGVVRTSYARRA
jgi:dihydrofolate reductase